MLDGGQALTHWIRDYNRQKRLVREGLAGEGTLTGFRKVCQGPGEGGTSRQRER